MENKKKIYTEKGEENETDKYKDHNESEESKLSIEKNEEESKLFFI